MSPGALCGPNPTLNVSIYPDSWCGCWRSSSSTSRGLPPLPPAPQAWHSHQASSSSPWRRGAQDPRGRDIELMAAPGKGFLSGRA